MDVPIKYASRGNKPRQYYSHQSVDIEGPIVTAKEKNYIFSSIGV